jgi:hypothetical protein
MRSRPAGDGVSRWQAAEALAAGLAYSAGLCWASVCLVASFRPGNLSAPYWSGVPGLRTDTSGIVAFFVLAVCFAASEFLRLGRRRAAAPKPGWRLACGSAKLLTLAVAETAALLATGLVGYLSVNAVTHPATLEIRATHLAAWPTEGTLRAVALFVGACSVAVLRYLLAAPAGGRAQMETTSPGHHWQSAVIVLVAAGLLAGAGFICSMTQSPQQAALNEFGISDPALVAKPATEQASELVAMKAIGITSVRLDASWASVQYGGPASFNWTALDRAVRSARAAGMSVDLIIDGCPAWAARPGTGRDASPAPESPAQYATWAADVAARYAARGVGMFEIWNEPNRAGFWSPRPDPAAYTADLKAAYASIKKADPSAFVISGGLAPEANQGTDINAVTFLEGMYAAGARGSFDALGYHPYSYPALPDTFKPWSGWSQMSQTTPSIRSVMTRNGDSAKQVWITEVGAPTGVPDRAATQAAQATALTQAIADAESISWVGALYVYTWQDGVAGRTSYQDMFGLITAFGTPKPAYAAVAAAIGRCGKSQQCFSRRMRPSQ